MFSILSQATQPAATDLPGWASAVMISIGAIVTILTVITVALWPTVFGLYKKIREDLATVRDTATAAKTVGELNSTRVTNLSNQHNATEQTITGLAQEIGKAQGAAAANESGVGLPPIAKLLAWFALPLLFISQMGCFPTRTSSPYQIGVKPAVDLVAHEMSAYTLANPELTPIDKANEQNKTNILSATVADVKKIDANKVASAWVEVKPAYRNYVLTDSGLPTERDKQDILKTSESIDALNDQELARQRNWFEAIFTMPIFTPATQPAK